MIIRNHVALQLFFTSWMIGISLCAQNETSKTAENSDLSVKIQTIDTTQEEAITNVNNGNLTEKEGNSDQLVKTLRRAASIDAAGSTPWVRIYNRPPGAKSDSYFNYGARNSTNAHTTGNERHNLKKNQDVTNPIDRADKPKVQDILRVRPTLKGSSQTITPRIKKPATISIKTPIKVTPTTSTTATPLETTTPVPVIKTNQTLNKAGYIIWTSNDAAPVGGWTLDDPQEITDKVSVPATNTDASLPNDGSKWKVVGEGGEDGWQVLDDNGDVEWKIEYDDGEWKVTSTGDIPADAEWADPEYIWGASGSSLAEDDEYNSWSIDDYGYSPWVDPTSYSKGNKNYSNSPVDAIPKTTPKTFSTKTGLKVTGSEKVKQYSTNAPIQFGARRKLPGRNVSQPAIVRDRTDSNTADVSDDTMGIPQSRQIPQNQKSWGRDKGTNLVPTRVEKYSSKTWEADNNSWNSGPQSNTWNTVNKDFPSAPWVPKSSTGQNQDISQNLSSESESTESPIRVWGTGYGSKTWKGNAWDSNIVWKTGSDGVLPWTVDNSGENKTWTFPGENNVERSPQNEKMAQIWSQPVSSEETNSNSNSKPIDSSNQRANGVKVKWPTKQKNFLSQKKNPPSRRTEESWEDDTSAGGIVWGEQQTETPATDFSQGYVPNVSDNTGSGWKAGGWKVKTTNEDQNSTPDPWKSKGPIKGSNLISIKVESADDSTSATGPEIWNQGQWPTKNINEFPFWLFGGCKIPIRCGTSESDENDDSTGQRIGPDTSDDDASGSSTEAPPTTVPKGWPEQQTSGKSWKPPMKSWKPPTTKQPSPTKSWKPPPTKSWKPPPTKSWKPPPTKSWKPPATKSWKPPTSDMSSKKPMPPPNVWKNPPSSKSWTHATPPTTILWTETPTFPASNKNWNPPATFPPSMKWKKPGPIPTKSWKPPPTKSWIPPSKNWKPSIATPMPDTWSTQTKPDCKDVTQTTNPTSEPSREDYDGENPPQIIVIAKLPKNAKLFPSQPDVKDTKDDSKNKIPNYPWIFPQRKNNPKTSKNRKDRISPSKGSAKKLQMPPRNFVKPGMKSNNGWPKGIPPSKFAWPATAMRRWPMKKAAQLQAFKKYMEANQMKTKPRTWKEMLKKWVNGR